MKRKINWDVFGIGTSVACAIHCALFPLLLSSLPILGIDLLKNPVFEYFMIILALIVGSFAMLHGYKKHHRNPLPFSIFAGGISLLFAKEIWHQYELWILPFAALMIISAHILNFRYCRINFNNAETVQSTS